MTKHVCEPHAPGTTVCSWCGLGMEPVDLDIVADFLRPGRDVPPNIVSRMVVELRRLRQWKSGAEVIIDDANTRSTPTKTWTPHVSFVPQSDRALTDRQAMVLAFVARFIRDNGYPPTLRDTGRGLGIRSTNGINDHFRALERKGCIDRDPMASRGTRLTAKGRSVADAIEAARVARSA